MQLSKIKLYRFEDVEVDLTRGCIFRDGKELHLRKKAFAVLVQLIENPERLVSKDELFANIWNGTAVTDGVLVQCIKEIRRAIGDDTHQPRFIKTVPKSGYRFIGKVQTPNSESQQRIGAKIVATTIGTPVAEAARTFETKKALFSSYNGAFWHYFVAATVIATLALGAVFYFGWNSLAGGVRSQRPDGRQTIAVMFFENRSKNGEFDWLREGLADMFGAGLSRSEKLTVLGRNQLHDLMDRSRERYDPSSIESAAEIARQAKADYFITGSFAQIGERIRIDIQLYDGLTLQPKATETLTVEKPEQLLTEIDLLSLKISNRLNAVPSEKRDLGSVMTNNLEAYRYYSLAIGKAQALRSAEAIDLLEKAVALDPEFAMAHARIGYVYAVTWGYAEKGKPDLEKAFRLSARLTDKDRMSILAWYSIANLDFAAAIGSYREIIERFPFETEAYSRLASLLAGEERPDEAIDVLRHGLNIDAGNKDLYNLLGRILSGQSKHADAIAAHERYVVLASDEPNAYDSLGLSYQWAGDYEKAIENFDRALEIDPRFEIAIVHLANTRFRLGQYREAIRIYERYVQSASTPNEVARGYDAIAAVFLELDDLTKAAQYADMANKIDPAANRNLYWNLYRIALKRGQTGKAQNLANMILSSNFGSGRGARINRRFEFYYRGAIALDNGKNDEAIELFRQTVAYSPPTWNMQDFEDCLGRSFLRVGRPDDAILELQRILERTPNYPLAHFHLAQAYQAKGLTDQARTYYQTFLDVWKDADADIPEIITARKSVGP